jgi:hypothetical protein
MTTGLAWDWALPVVCAGFFIKVVTVALSVPLSRSIEAALRTDMILIGIE